MTSLPIDSNTKEWIDARTSWILAEFGRDVVRSCTVVTPTSEYLPNHFPSTGDDARLLFDRLCHFMDLNPTLIDLGFYSEGERADGGNTTLGFFERVGDRFRIGVEVSQLHEPHQLAATMIHELSHVQLLGYGRVTEDEDDHEPLTDLLTVFLGMGIMPANAVLHDFNRRSGNWEMWQISRQGYLTMPMFGYALALLARIRDEPKPAWRKHLRPDVRQAFSQSARYLAEHGLPDLGRERTTTARPSIPMFDPEFLEAQEAFKAEQAEEEHDDGRCAYCQAELFAADTEGVCQECRESIEENQRDIEEAQEEEQMRSVRDQKVGRLGCATLVAIVLAIAILDWLGFLK